MKRYLNLNGNSGVVAYEIGNNSITVQFQGGQCYLYTYTSTGRTSVEKMKAYAEVGRGLGTYINQHVGKRYARHFRC